VYSTQAVEAIATLLSVNEHIVPPTLNLTHPSPAVGDLDCTPLKSRSRDIRVGEPEGQQVGHLLLALTERLERFSARGSRGDAKDAKYAGGLFSLSVGSLPLGRRSPALPRSGLADVHHNMEQVGHLTARSAERVDLPIPAAGLAGLSPLDDAKLPEFEVLEVSRLCRAADLTHRVKDATLRCGWKDVS